MASFRLVDDSRAGPKALGFLVPPGQRTLVIVRPRALEWDLLPIRFDRGVGSGFCAFVREEAAAMARKLQQTLEEAARTGERPVQVVANPAGDGLLVWLPMLDIMWMLCPRLPGRPYEPCVFETPDEAHKAVDRLGPYLWPAADAEQEYYFNTSHFSPARNPI